MTNKNPLMSRSLGNPLTSNLILSPTNLVHPTLPKLYSMHLSWPALLPRSSHGLAIQPQPAPFENLNPYGVLHSLRFYLYKIQIRSLSMHAKYVHGHDGFQFTSNEMLTIGSLLAIIIFFIKSQNNFITVLL